MKPCFIAKENFLNFEKQLPEIINTGKGTIVQNKEGESLLFNVIQKELTEFQNNSNNLQLVQKAVVINWSNTVPSSYTLEECSAAIQVKSQTWNVFPLKKSPENSRTSIYNSIKNRMLIGNVHQSKLVNVMPILPLLCISVFVVCLSISILLFRNSGFSIASFFTIGWSLSIATIISCLTEIFLKERAISRQDLLKIKDIITRNRDCQEYKSLISKMANEITQIMPVAIIVEDIGNLDLVTADVMDYIVSSGNITSIGAILWVVFHKQTDDGGYAIIQNSGMPSKHFVICRSIQFNTSV